MRRTWLFYVGWVVTLVAAWHLKDDWTTWAILGVIFMTLGLEERKTK